VFDTAASLLPRNSDQDYNSVMLAVNLTFNVDKSGGLKFLSRWSVSPDSVLRVRIFANYAVWYQIKSGNMARIECISIYIRM